MIAKSSAAFAASLLALVIGCSSESSSPSSEGGANGQGTGGESTFSNGGSSTTGNGGSTTTSNGGSTNTGNGGSSTTGNGGSTTTGNGGSTTTSNGGSTTTGNGGSTTTSNGGSSDGGSTTTAQGGSTAAAGASSLPCPDGCAQLSVPFTAYKAAEQFEIYLTDAVDLSAATINVKLRKVAGKAGGVQIVVKDGSPDYQWAQGEWIGINDLTSEFTTKSLVVASPASSDSNHVFDPTKVKIITLQVNAGDPWYKDDAKTMEDPSALINPTVIQVDEISISGATGAGPWTFATSTETTDTLKANLDASGQTASPPWAVAGSTVTWVGP